MPYHARVRLMARTPPVNNNINDWGDKIMNTEKIVGIIGVAVAIAGAFVAIPQVAVVLLVAGLIVGIFVIRDDHVRVMVTALVLTGLASTFNAVPAAGTYISAILANIGVLVTGVAVTIILRNIYARLKPLAASRTQT